MTGIRENKGGKREEAERDAGVMRGGGGGRRMKELNFLMTF